MTRWLALLAVILVCGSVAYSQEKPADKSGDKPKDKAPAAKVADRDAETVAKDAKDEDPEKVDWTKVDWRKRLSRMQYYVTRQAGTERAFKNKFWNFFKEGEYRCVGCGLPLFESTSKFDSECGWPSFDKTIAKDTVIEHEDLTLFQQRVEIRCRRCDAHLGHVFNDGPTDTGLRYCMNSVAMTFVPSKELKKQKAGDAKEAVEQDKAAAPADDAAKAAPK